MMLAGADVRAIKEALRSPADVCRRLGLLDKPARDSARYVIVRCPVHGGRKPSCSVFVAPDGLLGWDCKVCGEGGDVLRLVAKVRHLDDKLEFPAVKKTAAELAHVDLAAPPRPRELQPAPPSQPPPLEDVARLLRQSARVDSITGQVARWLRSRGLDPEGCSRLARAMRGHGPRWARYQGRSWADLGYRLLLPVYDAVGALRSVRARLVTGGDVPKSLPPSGHSTAGLVLANRGAVAMLRGGEKGPPARVVIAEGEPDYLTWASRLPAGAWAVLGLPGSGAWTAALAARIPSGSEVVIRTDPDAAGDRYAERVREDLGGRCAVRVSHAASRRARAACGCRGCVLHGWRWSTPCGRAFSKGEDDNALLMRGALPADPREGTEAI
jgi:5S rRNA maturation endonuclease (ribonuclease M5)